MDELYGCLVELQSSIIPAPSVSGALLSMDYLSKTFSMAAQVCAEIFATNTDLFGFVTGCSVCAVT